MLFPLFSKGGLFSGPYAQEAARRYELIWLPIILALPEDQLTCLTPPLDVAYAWLVSLPAPYLARGLSNKLRESESRPGGLRLGMIGILSS